MLVLKDIVYLELHKTGCTHIRNILKDLLGGEIIGIHNQASSNLFDKKRRFIGSIRDPWEWYISLWAYGCDNKGAVFKQVTKRGIKLRGIGWKIHPYAAFYISLSNLIRNPKKWKDTYKDVNDAGAFRQWLSMMHDRKYLNDIGGNYGAYSLCKIAGLLTFRYLKLFCTKKEGLKTLNNLSKFDQLTNYENENCFIDLFIRNERLEADLFDALENFGIEIPSDKKSEIISRPKSNVSSRKYGVEYYYDKESEDLIAERERLIVDKFGYIAPSLRN